MPLTILNNLLKNARDSSGTLFSTAGLKRCNSECFRNLQTQTEHKSQEEENAEGLGKRAPALWKSLTGREEGWKLFGSEQAANVLNYYKKRWGSRDTESPLDEKLDVDSLKAGRSLYSQWASRGRSNHDRPEHRGPLRSRDILMTSSNDPFRHQTERMMKKLGANRDESRERCLERLRRPISAPIFWALEKSPIDHLVNSATDEDATLSTKRQKYQPRHAKAEAFTKMSINEAASKDEYDEDDENDEITSEEESFKSAKTMKHSPEMTRTRPVTTGSLLNMSTDGVPLFDVKSMKKRYAFGSRL